MATPTHPIYIPPPDPMTGYKPLEYYQTTDHDHSAQRIRDMPYGKRRESLVIYPTELIFPDLPISATSLPYPLIITNDGYDTVYIKSIQVVGDFLLYGTLSSLAPGQHGSLQVAFVPKRDGLVTGGLYLDTGNAAGTEFVKLTGTGNGGGGYTRSLYYIATAGQKTFPLTTPDRFNQWYNAVPARLVVCRNGSRIMEMDSKGVGAYTMTTDKHGIVLTYPAGEGETVIIDI
jgi:hypothetical protein